MSDIDEKPEHHDEAPFADIVKDVEPKTTVADSVRALVEGLVLEFQAKAADGEQAVHDLADKMTANVGVFADAVAKNVESASNEQQRRGLLDEPLAPGDSETGRPHNSAAESAVAHGMDVEIANKMTAPGTNS